MNQPFSQIHAGWTVVALATCGLAGLAGCSDGLPHRVPVSGIVKIDGKPLSQGSVMVIPANDRPAGGSIGPDGRFTLTSYEPNDGVVVGTHKVTVAATEHLSERETRWLVPKKYNNAGSSGLTVTIDGPTDDLEINLTWDGKHPFTERM
ncbi:MAG: hypothetical protein KDA44_00400 [Planctomycetales bacterium]|nr:hypothetical protein [Planctomycetales bacterium]